MKWNKEFTISYLVLLLQARRVEEWQVRKARHDEEKELKRRQRLAKERMRAHAEAKANPPPPRMENDDDEDDDDGGAGGFKMPGGGAGGIPGLDKLLGDPEILQLFSDPGKSTMHQLMLTILSKILKFTFHVGRGCESV